MKEETERKAQACVARAIIRYDYSFWRRIWSKLASDDAVSQWLTAQGWDWHLSGFSGHWWRNAQLHQSYSAVEWAMKELRK